MNTENLELKSLKIKDGKVSTKWDEIVQSGDGSWAKNHDVTDKLIPHPDYTEKLNELSDYVAKACDLKVKWPSEKPGPSVRGGIKTLNEQIVSAIKVTGIALQGDAENRSVVITATRDVRGVSGERHTSQALNSPKININGDTFGFESTLGTLLEELIQEAFEYAVNGKATNPRLQKVA